jgi:Flp pilus assembly protein TadG
MKRFPRSLISRAAVKVCSHSAPRSRAELRSHLQPAWRERGTTLLESAVMISVMLLMVFGVVGFGTALYTYHFVSNTAREATRWASVRGSTCTGGLSGGCPAKDTDVTAYVQGLSTGIGLDPTKVTVNSSALSSESAVFAPTCPATLPAPPGCVVKVQVQYSFQFLFPLLPSGFKMQSTSQMVISQ